MQVTDGADVTLRRVALRQNEEAGLTVAQRGTHVTAEDLLVEETQSRESDGLHGVGIAVFAEAALEGGRISLRDNRQTGLGVLMGGRAVLTSVEIRGTLERACAATTCAGVGFGSGVVADEGGSVRLTEFAVSDNALCGVRVLRTAGVDLRDGTVSNHPIGANIEDATFDADRLSDQVAYVGNERNLARDTLPPPGLPAELADPQR
jgi:hypothetical protein